MNALATGGTNLRKNTMASDIKNRITVRPNARLANLEKNAFIFTNCHHLSGGYRIVWRFVLPPVVIVLVLLFIMNY
jgi:hypothetical protein